jgi:hypothetical protein
MVQLGFPPHRIDLLTSLRGVNFDEIWNRRVPSEIDGVPVDFIDRESFMKNKLAAGRTKAKADVEALGAGYSRAAGQRANEGQDGRRSVRRGIAAREGGGARGRRSMNGEAVSSAGGKRNSACYTR